MKSMRSFSTVKILVLALLFAGFIPARARAQDGAFGKFNLPFETNWGRTVLPAGDYSLMMPTTNLWGYVMVKKEPTGETVAILRADSWELAGTPASSRLTFERRGEAFFVRSLYLRDKGYVFSFAVHPAVDKIASRKPKEPQVTHATGASR